MHGKYNSRRYLGARHDDPSSRRPVTGTPISSIHPDASRGAYGTRRRRQTAKSQFVSKWYTPGTGPEDEDKVYMTRQQVRQLISNQLGALLGRRCGLYFADAEYYCTPIDNARDIIAHSATDQLTWVEEVFDCDDFAHALKAVFTQATYKEGRRRLPHCFGIIWGVLDGKSHAFNWMVNSDRTLRFVEPQNHEVFEVGPNITSIEFILG